jgi:DNA-directed RNA polymerase subunit RPC12/RpoP
MTAKKIVIHKQDVPTLPDKDSGKAKRPTADAGSKGTAKIDIGLSRALPSEETREPGRKSAAGGATGARKAGTAAGPSRGGERESAEPKKPIVIEPSPQSKRKEFRFLCNACGKKLQAPETAAGQTTKCPDCGNAITVPQPTAEPQTPKQQKRGVRYKKPKSFKFFCVRCGQSLEADRDLATTQLECPHCKSMIVVPPPADA